jgi:hypothetical protein
MARSRWTLFLRAPGELLNVTEAKDREVAEALATLRAVSRPGANTPEGTQ